jgi:RNA polymerase sigma-70 factor (ECF subfamily)
MAEHVRNRSTGGSKPTHGRALESELDRSFRAPLLAYFTKRVNNSSEAEDLTQEVFIRLLNHPDRNSGESLAGYVFTIAANLLRDRAKSKAAVHQKELQSFESLVEKDAFSPTLIEDRSPERILAGRQTIQDVLAALAELGERTRDIFILARLENMQHREIAALYGISVSTVEKSMMKAMAHLGALFLRG